MAGPMTPAQLSDLDFLSAFDEYVALRGPLPGVPQRCEYTSKAVKRRIFEAMMVNWAFGGPIRSSMTPAVTTGLGVLVSRSAYGGLVGTALGTAVSTLGPQFTKWHLSSYAEKDPDCTLASMAECWSALYAGPGDARALRLERVKPSLDSVPNGMRRWLGILFVYIQSSESLRKLFQGVYTDCLTVSPRLQGTVQKGKELLNKKRAAEALAKEEELARLRETVDRQAAMITELQTNRAYDESATEDSGTRLGQVEEAVARITHALGPLLHELGANDSAEVRILEVAVHSRRVLTAKPRTSTQDPGDTVII